MRLPLQFFALCAALGVMWIAFAHRIRLPFGGDIRYGIDSMAPLLGVLCVCALGLAWSYRAPLRDALRRATDGTSNPNEPNDPRDERAVRITLGLLVVSGFLLRIAGTGEYGLNPDEEQLVWIGAASTPSEVWAYERMVSPHPPGIFFLFHYMLKLSWDLVWLRLPAVLGGTLSIWLSYRFARELLGASAGLAIAWLVTFSPAILELSRLARNYAPGFALITLALVLFVRFVKTERWRYFAGYTAAAAMAMTWHYAFIVVFVALKLVLAIELLRRRAPLRSWLGVAALQLPFAGAMGFLYFAHISVLPEKLVKLHEYWYRPMLAFDVSSPLAPLSSLWQLLAPGWAGTLFMISSGVGVIVLAAGRQWFALSISALPIAVALVFAWSGQVPLGGSRHSVYLFPFLFLLVASNSREILTGYRTTRTQLARLARWMRWLEPSSPPRLSIAAWGTGLALSLAGFFAVGCLLDYNGESDRYPFARSWYQGRELVRSYPQADVERAFELLERHAGPNDWVLLGFGSAYTFRLHLQVPPVVHPNAGELDRRDISLVSQNDPSPLQRRHNGVQYYHSGLIYKNPADVLEHLARVSQFFKLKPPRKVWLMNGAWSAPFLHRFDVTDEAHFDQRVYNESHGLLFGIELAELRQLPGSKEKALPKTASPQRQRTRKSR